MDMSKYKGMFISETKEHLQTMNRLIVSLEKVPDDQEHIDALFRAAHSVKGMAASMGYHPIADLSHKLEDMMDLFRKRELVINAEAVDLLFEGLDALELMVKEIEEDRPAQIDTAPLLARLASVKKNKSLPGSRSPESADRKGAKEPVTAAPAAAESRNVAIENNVTLDVAFGIAASAQVPGMRAFLAYKTLTELGEIVSVDPDIEEVKKGNFDKSVKIRLRTGRSAEDIEKKLSPMSELTALQVMSVAEHRKEPVLADAAGSLNPAMEKTPERAAKKGSGAQTVRVSTTLLDSLINIVGEMIIARSRLLEVSKEIASLPLKEGQQHMSKLIRDLHNQVMSVRMTSMESLMDRLPRVVRDLARKSGKSVDLEIEGKHIELDRVIVDVIGDPLIHILRNCVDHGIELPEERETQAKPPAGRITLRAMRDRDQVIINISDDGRGMDPEKIKKKAIDRGLIKEGRAREMNDREAFMLVCHSGLSTAEQITDISGRGVGMDAVKSVVDSIGGAMYIDSIVGRGTHITLQLPLSVAIIQVLLIRIGNEVAAIPINKVMRTLEVSKADLKRSQKQLAVLVEDELIPLLSLRKILKIKTVVNPQPWISIVVVEMRNKKVGLVVDAFVGQQEAFVKPLESPLEMIKGLSGATIRGDGSVVFVLDVPNLL